MANYLEPRSIVWRLLKLLYSEADVQSWEEMLFNGTKTEKLQNLLTMSLTTHKAWDTCQFALLPLTTNAEKTEMHVRFFWLKVRARGNGSIPLITISDSPSDVQSGDENLKLWHCDIEKIQL